MKNLMLKAWEIATEAAAKFGGKKSEYISEAMKIAWVMNRIPSGNATRKMVVTGNKDNRTYKIERCVGDQVVEVAENLEFQVYANVYKQFAQRGFKTVEFYMIENGVKSFQGTKVVA